MQLFSELYRALDSTTSTNAKVTALVDYFSAAEDKDALWTIALFTHKRPRRTIKTSLLRVWAAEAAAIPLWLFEDSYLVAGDLAETMALIVPKSTSSSDKTLTTWINEIIALKEKEDADKKAFILAAWNQLDFTARFLFNKLITGGFRLGVSKKLITNALAKHLQKEESEIAHRLMGNWNPDSVSFGELLLSDDFDQQKAKPYPFYLAYPLEDSVESLGEVSAWLAEYKWDGIRGQIIKREGEIFVWSRGEDLVNDSFPEFQELGKLAEDGFVLDGEIVIMQESGIGSFQDLQSRLGRKTVSKKKLREFPVKMIVYDLLEWKGSDLRQFSQLERRQLLESFMHSAPSVLQLSEAISYNSWEELKQIRESARSKAAEGLMLKSMHGPYQIGRKKSGWWKWKLDPYTIDAVLLYAQRGHARRANLYTDYTFAVWNKEDQLVPFAKAYSGLTDTEFKEVTKYVNANTIERFGPVRSVVPKLVFELAFEGISISKRHKSGVALRFPRIHRWRKDKQAEEANRLSDLLALL